MHSDQLLARLPGERDGSLRQLGKLLTARTLHSTIPQSPWFIPAEIFIACFYDAPRLFALAMAAFVLLHTTTADWKWLCNLA